MNEFIQRVGENGAKWGEYNITFTIQDKNGQEDTLGGFWVIKLTEGERGELYALFQEKLNKVLQDQL